MLYRLLWIVVKVAHKNLSGSTSVLFESLAKENRYCSLNLHATDSSPDFEIEDISGQDQLFVYASCESVVSCAPCAVTPI